MIAIERKLVPIILLYYQFVKSFVHFRILNLYPFEFICKLNNPIRMRKKTKPKFIILHYIAKVYGILMN